MKKLKMLYDSKYFNLLLFLIYFMIPFILYYKFFSNNLAPFSGDGVQFFSARIFYNNSLKAGELPLWNPYLANGVPFAGDLNGAFYPISFLLSFLPIKLYIYCYYSLHIALGALFTYLFLKEINCDKFIAICTSFIYLFSIHLGGYRKTHVGIIVAVVFLPIILYYIEKFIKTKRIKYLLYSSIAMAIMLLNGGIQQCAYTDIVVFVYLVYRMISTKIPIKKMFANLIIWGITYIGISAIQLLPAIELLSNYKRSGSVETSYEYFTSYSINPIKIIMMLIPNMFGSEVRQALGPYYSSELDIEIFLGVGIFLIILFGVIRYFNDRRVRISAIFMAGAFLYASNAHIPILNKLIYNTPVLGGFRCPARDLYVFIFFGYVLFALSLSKLKEENGLTEFNKFTTKIFVLVCSVLIITIPFIYILSTNLTQEELITRYATFKHVFMAPVFAIFSIYIVSKVLHYIQLRKKVSNTKIYVLMSIIILILTIAETARFSMASEQISIDDISKLSEVTQNIKNDIDNNKLWLAKNDIDSGYRSIIEYNSNIAKEIPTINAYIAFNNPRLFSLFTNQNIMKPTYNSSGLLNGFPDAKNNLILQNDLISMLGIKYILDPQCLIAEDNTIITSKKEAETIYSNENILIPNKTGELYVYNDKIDIEPNTYYNISFDTTADQAQPSFYTDFSGPGGYDNPEQNRVFDIVAGNKHFETMVNSENSDIAEEVYFRFIVNPVSDIKITNIKITKVIVETGASAYVPYFIDENNRIFENTNAKDILYAPSAVVNITNVEDIYNNVYNYDLDDISYVENFEDFNTANTKISDIVWKRNSITAKVSADDSTFINYSQNYYPGWKAYVDGKETELYMVNGLIQGIKVPGGKHTVTFRFIPMSIIFGATISIVTILLALLLIVKEKKRTKKGI